MAKRNSTRTEDRRAGLSIAHQMSAWLHGRADGRLNIDYADPPQNGYLGELENRARQASKQLQSRLSTIGAQMLPELHGLAERLIQTQNASGTVKQSARGRFAEALTAWYLQVEEHRSQAEAVVSLVNQRRNRYWTYLTRRNQRTLEPRSLPPQPGQVTLDPIWEKGDPLVFLPEDRRSNGIMQARRLLDEYEYEAESTDEEDYE